MNQNIYFPPKHNAAPFVLLLTTYFTPSRRASTRRLALLQAVSGHHSLPLTQTEVLCLDDAPFVNRPHQYSQYCTAGVRTVFLSRPCAIYQTASSLFKAVDEVWMRFYFMCTHSAGSQACESVSVCVWDEGLGVLSARPSKKP